MEHQDAEQAEAMKGKSLKPVQINLVDTVPHGNPLATPTGKDSETD